MTLRETSSFLADLTDYLRRLRPYLSIAHQIPGRLRLRLSVGALSVLGDVARLKIGLSDLARLDGVETVRLNVAARSAVLTYDPVIIPDAFWQDCLSVPEDRLAGLIFGLKVRPAVGSA